MRAVVFATGHCPEMQSLTLHEPSVLLPVAGRPFLHYVVESLVDSGATKIDFILSDKPDKVEESLGDGTRWGAAFQYHLARDPAQPYGRLAVLGIGAEEPVIVAHGDRLPLWKPDAAKPGAELVLHTGEWTGWAALAGACLSDLDDTLNEAGLGAALAARSSPRSQHTDVLLAVRTFEELLEANWTVLEKRYAPLLIAGREAGEGIWISRNVSLHPTAQLTAPVFIGENCRINAAVRLGPRAVIGNNCLVDQASAISETVIFAGSYVGQHLELHQAIVDRNRLVNVQVGAAITVADNFILGSFVERDLQQLTGRALSRVLAVFLLVLLSPLLLLAWLWSKLTVHRKTVVQLPAAGASEYTTYDLLSFCKSPGLHSCSGGAHEFFRHFLPGLINVAGGRLRFAGVAPRNAEEIEALPRDWKGLYLRTKAGLVTEAYVVHGPAADEDLLYSAEVFYAAMAGRTHDARLMAGYLARVLGLKRTPAPLGSPGELEE